MKSIWIKLAFQISLAIMGMMILIGCWQIYQQRLKDILALQNDEESIMKQLSLILRSPLYNIDYLEIENIFRSYLADPNIFAIKVMEGDKIGKYLGKAVGTAEILDLTRGAPQYTNSQTKQDNVLYDSKALGIVEVTFSHQIIYEHIRQVVISTVGSLLLVIVSGSAVILLLVKKHVTTPLLHLVQVANHIAEGDIDVPLTQTFSRNEIGQIQIAMKNMIHYIQDVAGVAERISNNDLQVTVMPKSQHDMLNHSLARMVHNLQTVMDANKTSMAEIEDQNRVMKQQNWVKDGIGQLNAALLGETSIAAICSKAASFAARYLNAGCAVLYTYNQATTSLTLQGTFAFTEHDCLFKTYQLGEGVIGQVAVERAPILLTQRPSEDRLITTGTFSGTPLNTYTFPLLYNDDLYGVFELASFEPFDSASQEFLNDANRVIATVLFSAMQRERMQQLLQGNQPHTLRL